MANPSMAHAPQGSAVDDAPETSQAPGGREQVVDAGLDDLGESRVFDLSMFIPRPDFCPSVDVPRPLLADGNVDEGANYVELRLPTQGQEAVRELQQSILESPEGWWMGAFGLRRVDTDDAGRPVKPVAGKEPAVLGDFAELGAAFEGDEYKDYSKKRALEAAPVDYTELTARLHILRMRDVLYAQAPGLLVGNPSPMPPYDPSQLGIGGGSSLFTLVRGPQPVQESQATDVAPAANALTPLGKSKGKGKVKQSAPKPDPAPPVPVQPTGDVSGAVDALLGFTSEGSPFAGLTRPQEGKPSDENHPTSRYLKHFALSPWSPPPHHLRLRGHLTYLCVTTFEGESLQITSHAKGFYVNKSTISHFDPSPRPPKGQLASTSAPIYFRSLPALLSSLSLAFTQHLSATWKSALSPTFPDLFSGISITNCLPAFPWLVAPPKQSPDGIRSQLAYLITGSSSAETLAPARDWADEFAQARDMPKKSLQDRILRERVWSRLQSDFTSAAIRGVIACSRGEIAPLNPHEPDGAWTFVHNNMLFSKAEDEIGAYSHLGGSEAARLVVSKDIAGVKILNELDTPGVFTMGSIMVDYHGRRWLAQGVLPGIFRSLEPEKNEGNGDKPLLNGVNGTHEGGESVQEVPSVAPEGADSADLPAPTPLYDIVYGSADIEKPEAGLKTTPVFHKLAKAVSEHFNIAEHKVTDANGEEHDFWMSADIHGIRGADGRHYMIDLYRITPADVGFLENDINGPIYDGKADLEVLEKSVAPAEEDDVYPHRLVLLRLEAVTTYKGHLFREFALQQIDIQAKADKDKTDAEKEGGAEKTDGSAEERKQYVIDSSSFKFLFNPDAFVDRKDQKWSVRKEEEDEPTRNVRAMSAHVRGKLVDALVAEMAEIKILPVDGQRLTDAFHARGVNMRYLGRVAHIIQTKLPELDAKVPANDEVIAAWKAAVTLMEHEMVFRAGKHILKRLLTKTSESEACDTIAHFLNCLLGTATAAPVEENSVSPDAEWCTLTKTSLQAEIVTQVRRRFRYALPETYFVRKLAYSKPQMLREICTRIGIQLALREYPVAAPAYEPELVSNGVHHSTDEERSASSPEPSTSASRPRKGKKKAAKKVVVSGAEEQPFLPSDVLNLLPVVKDAASRSAAADELFAEGRRAFSNNQPLVGQELCTDAINAYEQVFGAVHPELARHWHGLALQYHHLMQQALMEIGNYQERFGELTVAMRRATTEAEREAVRDQVRRIQELTDVDQLKREIDQYVELAATNLRQSVIVAERTLGFDHPDTAQYYLDLAVMELNLNNVEVGMKLALHSLELWRGIYGPGIHPDASSALLQAASLIQPISEPSGEPNTAGLMDLSRQLVASFFGRTSGKYAEITVVLAHLAAMSDMDTALKYAKEAAGLYVARYGEENHESKQANHLVDSISRTIEQAAKGEEERTAKLAKRLGLDPKRAAALRSKVLSPAPAVRHIVEAPPPVPSQAVPYKNIDDVVRYIQGSPVKPKTARSRQRTKH